MLDDINFANSFRFCTFQFNSFHFTDNRRGSPSHYFAYMLSGKCKIVVDGNTVEINEGEIFYIPYKCSYRSYWYGENKVKFISLGFIYLPNFENKTYPVQVLPYMKEAIQLFDSLVKTDVMTADKVGIFYTLAGMLLPSMKYVSMSHSQEVVDKTKRLLIQNPYATIQELAKNCAICEAALYAAFKKSSDITPNQMRNQILLEKAKDTLISTDKSVEYISDTMGYSSPSYFRKKFKQFFGITPKEMRKRYRI